MSKPWRQTHQDICDQVFKKGRKIGEHTSERPNGQRVIARSDAYGAWTVRRDIHTDNGVAVYVAVIIFANRVPIARYVAKDKRPALISRIYETLQLAGMERTA